ncbi:hypothetical protein [Salisediminibacterium halotolerans]|uniref:Uncharacterized protein n=1 Tax=Salisediminibacterium halotolerans TaxID=517425 RepID=A0A1H9WVV0_9BACI|nr:hypothetical protein [Salisediminibacterium haloalkalitolerans]SES38070.1 hypothetical protein SAMN05444126_1524 [Salisediminibacterium haloalkalitolerans]
MDDNHEQSREEQIINSFKQDEKMMAHVYAQWCINHGIDPAELYREAYGTADSQVLHEAMALTVPKEEAGDIATETLLGVLSLYGNDDLAEQVTKKAEEKGLKER